MARLFFILLLWIFLLPQYSVAQSQDDIEFDKEIRSMYQEMQERLIRNNQLLKNTKPEDIYILKDPNAPKPQKTTTLSPTPIPSPIPESQPETQPAQTPQELQAPAQKPPLVI